MRHPGAATRCARGGDPDGAAGHGATAWAARIRDQALGIPTLALAYHPKTVELLGQVGQSESCLDIDSFELGELYSALERLRADDGPVGRAELREQARKQRTDVETQFDDLFGPIA
jgi:hypothetical protein